MREEAPCNRCGSTTNKKTTSKTGRAKEKIKIYKLKYCVECRKVEKKIYDAKRRAGTPTYSGNVFTCLYDPSDMYTDSMFTSGHFEGSLEDGYLPPGSKWKEKETGITYVVEGNELFHLMHNKAIGPDNRPEDVPDELCEGQRKVMA